MTDEMQAVENTDRELWREVPGDYYAPSIFVTQNGGIGINVGGNVIVLPLKEWHALWFEQSRLSVQLAQARDEWDAIHAMALQAIDGWIDLIGDLGHTNDDAAELSASIRALKQSPQPESGKENSNG